MLQSLAWEAKLDSPEPVKKKKKRARIKRTPGSQVGESETTKPWRSLSETSRSELWVQEKILSRETRWQVVKEDTWYPPPASPRPLNP